MPEEQESLPLPAGVYEKHGSWHLVQKNHWRKLCRVKDGRATLYQRLEEVTGGVNDTVWHAVLAYLQRGMRTLKPATQKHYRNTGLRMLHHFGHLRVSEIEPMHCKQFMKWCVENNRGTTGNREKAFMSSVYEFAMGEGWASYNPWRGIRRNTERPSRVYVDDATLVSAIDRAPPELQAFFAIGYLTGIRETDLMTLKWENVLSDRIEFTESKTGKHNAQPITKTVRQFLVTAAAHAGAAAAQHEAKGRAAKAAAVRAQPFVFLTKRGLPWTENGLQSALRRFQAGFRFRELRAKAQTDSPNKNILGHSGQLRERYTRRRKLDVVK